jgi:hypothetical protein
MEGLSLACAEEASRDNTSSTDVFPVPFAPIITDSGRKERRTSRKRRKPSIESWPKPAEE